jgi:hypothetical protein
MDKTTSTITLAPSDGCGMISAKSDAVLDVLNAVAFIREGT